ncbi:myosin phosphatase Rho-interacting protein [Oryzias melastigma]|uniref:Myosin phosphatase Rho-interacting protein-like n=1 Tax=Oryzias melastigma TaxID=30732 RepID=A0A3B3DR67_ORYME|nr:myosin phosphatase Rho-interacting protein [Oryzias melastigma]
MATGVLGLTDVPPGSAAQLKRSGRAAGRPEAETFTAKQRAMAGEKTSGSCSRFQANIFNRNKCQNCFKSRELHLLNELEMERAKPVYAGWLCLAPEGTDFGNPVQRSRKWQRRFFILFEHGGLSFALDELPSTLPQGTVDMNACTDICDAEPRTGQKNSLCVATPERDVFIRGDSREIINGWNEQLCVFLRTNKQNLKKKRKVEPVANQEPSPAKMAATGATFPGSDGDPTQCGAPDPTPPWTVPKAEPPGPDWTPAGMSSSILDPLGAARRPTSPAEQKRRWDSSPERPQRSGQEGGAAVCRQGRTESRPGKREKLPSCGDTAQLCAPPPQRRAKSLDRRTSDTVMTPDLLNFKKGWMVKLDENGEWKKFWFVLSTDSLRYFRDSLAEETSDLEGEIDLTNVFNVSEYEVQRNYGFQIHTAKAAVTLSAMTAGIRRNWIQALLRNVHPANAPDVASVPALQAPCPAPEVLPKPDVTQDSAARRAPLPAAKSVAEKRGEGRYKTFDWAELWPQSQPGGLLGNRAPCSLELGDVERQRRREERRKRYENTLGVSLRRDDGGQKSVGVSAKSQQRMEEEIEECWRLVERSALRPDRTVPLDAAEANAAEAETLLRSCRKTVEDLKVQLAESERRRLTVEAQLCVALHSEQQTDSFPLATHEDVRQPDLQDLPEPLRLEAALPSIWLDDTDGHLRELETRSRVDPEESTLQSLSREVEQLSAQNGALKQRSQEMLNQLTEADREIARLKAELSSRHQVLEAEQRATVRLEELEEELSCRNQKLLDLQRLVGSLQENLRDAGARLNESEEVRGDLHQRLEAAEVKLTQLEEQLDRSQLTCRELQNQNAELTEEKNLYCERAVEVEALRRRLQDEESREEDSRNRTLSDEEKFQLVVKGMKTRTKAVMKILEVTDGLEFRRDPAGQEEEEEHLSVNQLKREEEFWSLLLRRVKAAPPEDPAEVLFAETMECVMLEHQMLLAAHALLHHTEATESQSAGDPDIIWMKESLPGSTEENSNQERLTAKMSLLEQMSSSCSSDLLQLQPAAGKLLHLHFSERPPFLSWVDSAAAEALMRLHLQSRRQVGVCASCSRLAEENRELRARMSTLLTEEQHSGAERRRSVTPDTSEENLEILQTSELRGKVTELEEQLEVLTKEKEEFDERRKAVQEQHQSEVDKMKVTCERGLALMEECHLKVLEELQCLHQLELERLLEEGDRLLKEESVATATAIKAIEKAHGEELQKVQQRSERRDSPLEDVYRQHREELVSCQRELDVLSQQFSMKCLENRHLIQALDAERKALSQCQQENQDLRSRNQELSGHLTAEISRLCSESLPLSREVGVYEMEVTLRVKDSEVHYLKREITSLRDKLLSALKEQRSTNKKDKDVCGEPSEDPSLEQS